jgi:pheromone shutdown protein TraB
VSDLLSAARSGRVDDDTVDVMLAALAEAFPSITAPLVTERDAYLAWSLKRSRAVCGKRRVVGVIGRAHLAGVVAALQQDCGGDTLVFKDLVGQRSSSSSSSSNGGKRSSKR